MSEPPPKGELKHTPLHALHVRLGGRMVPFAGYAMPVQYSSGIIKEHLHTRAAAGLFDVSHMGQIALRPRSGRVADAARALEALLPGDILGLAPGRQRYTVLTNGRGGILDDLMVANHGDHLMLVVNAARKVFDETHLRSQLSQSCTVEPLLDRALVALQGPAAEAVLETLAPEVRGLWFMDVRVATIPGATCFVSRSGYTGEDGFEISVPANVAEPLCDALLRHPAVAPVGLGARDSLRLEAGLCLYGADLDETTTPVEAALDWTIGKARRPGGERAGGFPGAEVILGQLAGGVTRRRVGLRPEGRAPVRAGAPLFRNEDDAAPVGVVTSGGFAVSLNVPVAMGYVPPDAAVLGTRVFTEIRGKRLGLIVSKLPFVPARYKHR
jgi:glycine cleavage system T protein (aminomethyltransferase)